MPHIQVRVYFPVLDPPGHCSTGPYKFITSTHFLVETQEMYIPATPGPETLPTC